MELRSSRQRKGVSLEEIADRTKISIRFLRAIEAEDFDQLPGGIFATSYLRQYAAHAGVEESRLLACYRRKRFAPEESQQDGSGSDASMVKSTLIRFWRASVAGGQ